MQPDGALQCHAQHAVRRAAVVSSLRGIGWPNTQGFSAMALAAVFLAYHLAGVTINLLPA